MPKPAATIEHTIPVDIALDRVDDFRRLLERCAEIFNRHVDTLIDNPKTIKRQLTDALYVLCRLDFPEVPSALIQAMRDTASEAVTAWRTTTAEAIKINKLREAKNSARVKQGKRPLKLRKLPRRPRKSLTSAIRYDARTFTKRGDQLTLSTIGNRERLTLQLSDYHRQVADSPDWQLQSATVGYKRKIGRGKAARPTDRLVINLTYVQPAPFLTGLSRNIEAGDGGIINQLTLTDGTRFSSKPRRANQRRNLYNRTTLQAKGTRSARKRLKKLSGREKRFSLDVDRCLAKIVASLPFVVIALENLKHISDNNRGKHGNKRLGSWTFAQFIAVLEQACRKVGKRVILVDPKFTSQECAACGHIDKANRNGGRFKCLKCGFKAHADVNAAINIRRKAIKMLQKLALGTSAEAFEAAQLLCQLDLSASIHQDLVAAADRRIFPPTQAGAAPLRRRRSRNRRQSRKSRDCQLS